MNSNEAVNKVEDLISFKTKLEKEVRKITKLRLMKIL